MKTLSNFGSGSVQAIVDFIDLLQKRIDSLNDLISRLSQMIQDFKDALNLPAGHLLLLPPAVGGVNKFINEIQTANGGPTSGDDGYVVGCIFLFGGPDSSAVEAQFNALKLILGE